MITFERMGAGGEYGETIDAIALCRQYKHPLRVFTVAR